jgi:hypothetical protein
MGAGGEHLHSSHVNKCGNINQHVVVGGLVTWVFWLKLACHLWFFTIACFF